MRRWGQRLRYMVLAIVFAPATSMAACSSFTSGDTAPPDASGDAPSEAPAAPPPPPDGVDAPADAPEEDAGPNLLKNPSFEDGCTWGGEGVSVSVDTTARTGKQSCRVCVQPGVDAAGGVQLLFNAVGPFPPATYVFTAWTRATPDPDGGPPPSSIEPAVILERGDASTVASGSSPGQGVGATSWQQAATMVTSTSEAAAVVELEIAVHDGNCFLVDDVRFYGSP